MSFVWQTALGVDYTFPVGFSLAEQPTKQVIPVSKMPKADGGRTILGTLQPQRLTIRGAFVKGSVSNSSDVRADLDTLRSVLMGYGNAPGTLYLYGDRYRRLLQADVSVSYQPTQFLRFAAVQIDFLGGDPYEYLVTTAGSPDNWGSPVDGSTHTITTHGNAPVQPVYSIAVAGTGTQIVVLFINNTTTGRQMAVGGQCNGGDTIVIDTLNATLSGPTVLPIATIGGVDRSDLVDGDLLPLAPGANVLQLINAGPAVISSIQTAWVDRMIG